MPNGDSVTQMPQALRLMTIHAHPDDEASKGASLVAKYAAEGVETVLVCATGGEEGDIVNPAMDRPEILENLTAVRIAELKASTDLIGFDRVHMLGYRDSGMAKTEANKHPECFAAADLDEAVGRLVALIRGERPHVIITYSDDQQGYLHPDHLRVHDISGPAFAAAGDPDAYPGVGEPWQPLKLYYSTWCRARLVAMHEAFEANGLESPFTEQWFKRPFNDDRLTTQIDIGEWFGVRGQALLAHATQVDPNEKFWFGLPDDISRAAYPYDDYILALSHVETELPESDMFAGIREDVTGS